MASTISAGTTSGTAIAIAGDTSGALALQTNNGTTAVTIDASQNVGIGLSTMTAKFVVAGTAAYGSGSQATYPGTIQINESGNYTLQSTGGLEFKASVYGSGYGAKIFGADNGSLLFGFRNNSASWTESMRIDSSGNLLVGTTSYLSSTARVTTLTSGDGFRTQIGNGASGYIVGNTSGTASYNAALFYNNNFSSLVGYISINGTTASYVSTSDYRLKENVLPMTGGLEKVAKLKPVTYSWKSDGSAGQGFIAHELAEVVPDAVSGEKDAVNEDGSIKPQGIDTSFLVATLTSAIQELNAKVDAQALEIQALKGNTPLPAEEQA